MAAERDDKPERQVLIDAIGRMLRLHEGHTFDVLAKRIADEVLSLRSAVAAPFVPWDLETVKQEIRDLFARYGSGDYTPSEEEKEIIENALDEILTPPPVAQSASAALEEKPVAWLIERPKGTGKQQTLDREVVLSPLTDDTFMDEGDQAWPLYRRSADSRSANGKT